MELQHRGRLYGTGAWEVMTAMLQAQVYTPRLSFPWQARVVPDGRFLNAKGCEFRVCESSYGCTMNGSPF